MFPLCWLLIAVLGICYCSAYLSSLGMTRGKRNYHLWILRFSADSVNNDVEQKAKDMFERTKRHFNRLQSFAPEEEEISKMVLSNSDKTSKLFEQERELLVKSYMKQSSNKLKELLKQRKLSNKGAKPSLAQRLANYDLQPKYPHLTSMDFRDDVEHLSQKQRDSFLQKQMQVEEDAKSNPLTSFGSALTSLSKAAGTALRIAGFEKPSPIQQLAFPMFNSGKNFIIHAETGSGKTLAYLLPITERLWQQERSNYDNYDQSLTVILTPTRELAAQVAGVASVLAPPGSVRLITQPSNLLTVGKDQKVFFKDEDDIQLSGGIVQRTNAYGGTSPTPRIFIGSARAIYTSLYGDGKMPAAPTPKPLAVHFVKSIKYLVLDEVDRLLDISSSTTVTQFHTKGSPELKKIQKKSFQHIHERPAAVIASAAARYTLGKVQVIAASATVGRPLRRELSRVLGLTPQDCPETIRAENLPLHSTPVREQDDKHLGRAVTIPSSVKNYVLPVNGTTSGSLLVAAANVAKQISASSTSEGKSTKILLVLTKKCGLAVHETVGALKHFGVTPQPKSLIDALLDSGEGRKAVDTNDPDGMIEIHRKVSGANGVGASDSSIRSRQSYLLVAGEESIRGLHLEGLETVIVIGRADSPDEYSHVAGRTGRMGKKGRVINMVYQDQTALFFNAWEKMLMVKFLPLTLQEVPNLPTQEYTKEQLLNELNEKRLQFLSSLSEETRTTSNT